MYTFSTLEEKLFELAEMHSKICITKIGHSVLGVPLYAAIIAGDAPPIGINAAHHANEWITTPLVMRWLEEFLACPPAHHATIHIIPMVNPDGADAVIRGQLPPQWKANIRGVDLNSNYPAGWWLARHYKHSRGYDKPGARDFVGTEALSEPESRALYDYTNANDFALTLSLHTQGEEIYHRYNGIALPEADTLADEFARASGYALTEVPPESDHAGYRDWFITQFRRPGFTIECGMGESPLPFSQLDEMYKKVAPILTHAATFHV
jgi:g-D-glutamyl-meso-diaminopimelate peptidase